MGWAKTAPLHQVLYEEQEATSQPRPPGTGEGGDAGLPRSQKITLKLINKNFLSSPRSTEGPYAPLLGRQRRWSECFPQESALDTDATVHSNCRAQQDRRLCGGTDPHLTEGQTESPV